MQHGDISVKHAQLQTGKLTSIAAGVIGHEPHVPERSGGGGLLRGQPRHELEFNSNLATQLEMNWETLVLQPAGRASGTRFF